MGRKILAVIVAMITGVAIIWVGWMISTMLAFNTPKNLEYLSTQDIDTYARSLPTSAYIAALIGYAVAAFAGGFISTKMGRRWGGGMSLALVVGGLLTVGSLLTSFTWPQPMWLVLVSLLIFIPFSLIGYRFAHKV
jgi:lysylphosphatidylglycerol synthetase-like protein (DUF2156 family)